MIKSLPKAAAFIPRPGSVLALSDAENQITSPQRRFGKRRRFSWLFPREQIKGDRCACVREQAPFNRRESPSIQPLPPAWHPSSQLTVPSIFKTLHWLSSGAPPPPLSNGSLPVKQSSFSQGLKIQNATAKKKKKKSCERALYEAGGASPLVGHHAQRWYIPSWIIGSKTHKNRKQWRRLGKITVKSTKLNLNDDSSPKWKGNGRPHLILCEHHSVVVC